MELNLKNAQELIENALNELMSERAIFHNEQDFQFELAWKLRELSKDENIKVRLEYLQISNSIKNYIDIVLIDEKSNVVAIELKYKMKIYDKVICEIKNSTEIFCLVSHQAHNHNSYWFWNDIKRIERVSGKNSNFIGGFAIFLTNDSKYWEGLTKGTYFEQFSLKDGLKDVKGKLDKTGGTSTFPVIDLKGNYDLNWEDYSAWQKDQSEKYIPADIKEADNSKDYFKYRYLMVKVEGEKNGNKL